MYTGRSLYTFAWLRGMMKISIIRWIAGFGIELPELNWTQWLAIGFRHENWFNIDGIIGEWVKLTQIFYSRILFSRIKKIRWNSLWNENSIIIALNAELLQNPIKLSTSFDEEELEFMPSTADFTEIFMLNAKRNWYFRGRRTEIRFKDCIYSSLHNIIWFLGGPNQKFELSWISLLRNLLGPIAMA